MLGAHTWHAIFWRVAMLFKPPRRIVLDACDEERICSDAQTAVNTHGAAARLSQHAHGSAIFGWSVTRPVQRTGLARISHETVNSIVSATDIALYSRGPTTYQALLI